MDCMVELVKGNQGVVVVTKSSSEWAETCIRVFSKVIGCVMEAKAEFCHSIKPQFFLLDSTAEKDYFNEDNMFAVSDVERVLTWKEKKNVIISLSGRGLMRCSQLLHMCKLTHWNEIFPMDFNEVLHCLKDIDHDLYQLGGILGAPSEVLQAIDTDTDVSQGKKALVRWWMSSSHNPPCWLHLVQALERMDENVSAQNIRKKYCESGISNGVVL